MTEPVEPILTETVDRLILFPIKYPNIWEMYIKNTQNFWTPSEIDLVDDIKQWEDVLTPNERYFISHILAFFASSDTIVSENLATRFYNEIQIPECRMFLGFQLSQECIHSHTYGMLIETLIKDEDERLKLFNAIKTIPCIKKKAEWALKHINNSTSFAERVLAFVLVEGLFFSGSFCSIYWLKKRGLMPGLSLANNFISKEEGSHQRFGCAVYAMLQHKLSQEKVYDIVTEAVEHECIFITESLPVSLIGMNSDLMCTYIKYVADMILYDLGYSKFYKVENPFPFMIIGDLKISKGNFFETRIAEYAKVTVENNADSNKFLLDGDF